MRVPTTGSITVGPTDFACSLPGIVEVKKRTAKRIGWVLTDPERDRSRVHSRDRAKMQRWLAAKQIGAKREFLHEVVKEVRVRGKDVTVTDKLPLITSFSARNF